jgi:hypothetical protein
MAWDHFLQVKFGRSPADLAVSRYAIMSMLYRQFEHDPEKWAPVFRRDKREAFARRLCSRNEARFLEFDKRATDP